jgi:hypothetical protein
MSIGRCFNAVSLALVLLMTACTRSGGDDAGSVAKKKPEAPTVAVSAPAAGGVLDGKTFSGEFIENGNKSAGKDQLVFADGTFHSVECQQYGFVAVPYRTTAAGDAITFDAIATSAKEGKMTWHGVADGETITGTALWEKEGQASIAYTYTATITR